MHIQKAQARAIKAAVIRKKGGPFQIETLTLEEPRSDEVLIRIAATGMCHTDMVARDQLYTVPLPVVLGHEGAGVVERVGGSVKKVAPGDHVVLTYMWCGHCTPCLNGDLTYCAHFYPLNFGGAREDGSTATHDKQGAICDHFFGQSSFGTFALAHERNVVKVPNTAPLELFGPLGCGIQTGAGAVMNALKVRPGSSFAAFGGGADFTLESSGRPAVLRQAIDALAIRGVCGIVGAPALGTEASSDVNGVMTTGKRILGIIEGDSVPDLFIPSLVDLYVQGRFPFDQLVKFYSFDQINQAAEDSEKGRTIKPIVRMDS
jgi:aryl-alcohol dehydrogenase